MRFVTPAYSVVCAALVLANKVTSDIIGLTMATFESTVNAEPLLLVEFVSPHSVHSKALAPHYEEAATALKEKNIKLAKVDCIDQADLCQSIGIRGYPTLRVYRHGEAKNYNGPRKSYHIISYMIHQHYLTVFDVKAENHEAFTKSDNVVVIAYLSSTTDALAVEFNATAHSFHGIHLFGMMTDQDSIKATGVIPPAIVAYRSFDEPKLGYPHPVHSLTRKNLGDWVRERAVPIMGQYSYSPYGIYVDSRKPLALLHIDPRLTDKDAHISAFTPVAVKYKSKINFAWIDESSADAAFISQLDGDVADSEAKLPMLVIHDLHKRSSLRHTSGRLRDVTPESATEWIEQYLGGLHSQADETVYS